MARLDDSCGNRGATDGEPAPAGIDGQAATGTHTDFVGSPKVGMAMTDSNPIPLSILVVGPSPDLIGGMAHVVGSHRSLRDPRIRCSFLPLPLGNRPGLIRSILRHVAHTLQLIRVIGRSEVRILHLHTCSGATFWRTVIDLFFARALGCKVVLHVHGGEFQEFYLHSRRPARFMIRHCLHLADRVIALSSGWKRTILRIAPGATVSIIENAVENPPSNSHVDHPGSAGHFLLLSKMDESKGVLDALVACRLLADTGASFQLILAGPTGTAGDTTILNERIQNLELNEFVHYVGIAAGKTKQDLLEECNVLLLPSWFEGMPITVLEALTRSIAVIVTNVGAVPEIIDDGVNGILIPPKNPAAIAAAMRALIENPERRDELARAGKRLAEDRFSISRFHRDLVDLYAELASAPDCFPRQAMSPAS